LEKEKGKEKKMLHSVVKGKISSCGAALKIKNKK
jgi:hypothetical protein